MHTDNLSLTHLVQKPREQTSGKPPLLLLLHGIGSNEEDLFSLAPYLDGRFLTVSARAPVVMGAGAFGWFNIEYTPRGMIADIEQAGRSLELLPKFIDELIATYEVDERCIYLAGFSQGAMMSLGLTLIRPEKVAGVVAMSGRIPAQMMEHAPDMNALTRMPILITHGLYDPVLPIEHGRAARKYLETLPVELTYREYPMEHEVSMECLRDVAAWLKQSLDVRCAAQGT